MANNYYDIAIIGGGASGLMLAAALDMAGRPGIILEGTGRLGSKLLMSGGGRCNITHAGSVKVFPYAYGDAGPLLRKCLYRHSNIELVSWFESAGVPLTDEGGRVFPTSGKAKDILDALISEAASNLWQIETDAKVCGLARTEDGLWKIDLSGRSSPAAKSGAVTESAAASKSTTAAAEYSITAANVVIASGGITYPETGSDGSLFSLLEGLGISITPPRPALSALYIKDYPYSELSGISLPDVTVTVFGFDAANTCKGKASRMSGDLLFTHEGLSGPVILNISGYAEPGETIRLSYNKDFTELPKRMQRVMEERAKGPSGDIRSKVLASLLGHDDFIVSGIDKRGMVSAGGVSLSEIDMSTMQIREPAGSPGARGGLYIIGEAINAYGITGGYNLQLCWSTAQAAADSLRLTLSL